MYIFFNFLFTLHNSLQKFLLVTFFFKENQLLPTQRCVALLFFKLFCFLKTYCSLLSNISKCDLLFNFFFNWCRGDCLILCWGFFSQRGLAFFVGGGKRVIYYMEVNPQIKNCNVFLLSAKQINYMTYLTVKSLNCFSSTQE